MSYKAVGNPEVLHVQQPAGSELCFAALSAAASGVTVDAAHEALTGAYLSEDDGSTPPPFEQVTEVAIANATLRIVAIQGYEQEASDTAGVISNIDESLQQGQAVALLYKKSTEPSSGMHWVLLTGYRIHEDGSVIGVEVMDPLHVDNLVLDPLEVTDMIERSMQADGVFAYSLEVVS